MLSIKDEGSEFTRRQHYEQAARQGDTRAIARLEGPEFPDVMTHLYVWLMELFGHSGVGLDGFAPLTYGTIVDWARLTGRQPDGADVLALMRLDAILRHPTNALPGEE